MHNTFSSSPLLLAVLFALVLAGCVLALRKRRLQRNMFLLLAGGMMMIVVALAMATQMQFNLYDLMQREMLTPLLTAGCIGLPILAGLMWMAEDPTDLRQAQHRLQALRAGKMKLSQPLPRVAGEHPLHPLLIRLGLAGLGIVLNPLGWCVLIVLFFLGVCGALMPMRIFQELGAELPAPTQLCVDIRDLFEWYGPQMMGATLLVTAPFHRRCLLWLQSRRWPSMGMLPMVVLIGMSFIVIAIILVFSPWFHIHQLVR